MERVARRYVAAAAVLTAGSLVVAVPTMTRPSLPDVQVRDGKLAASVMDQDPDVNSFYDLLQHELSGNADLTPHDGGLDGLVTDRDDSGLGGIENPALNVDDATLPQDVASGLPGVELDPAAVQAGPIAGIEQAVNGFDGGGIGGAFGGGDQGAATGSNVTAVAAVEAVPAVQAAYQGFTTGLVSAEIWLNHALVDAQLGAAERLFGDDVNANELANLIFAINNASIAHLEAQLNDQLGASFDIDAIQNSLLGDLDTDGIAQAGWAAALGLTPDDLDTIVQAAAAGNLFILLSDMDWSGLFAGLF